MHSSSTHKEDNGPLLWHHFIASISFDVIMNDLKVLDYKYHIAYVSKDEWKPLRLYCSFADRNEAIFELDQLIRSIQSLSKEVSDTFNFELTVIQTSIVGTAVHTKDITPPETNYTCVTT